jgi:small subunit ribosomal protein S15
MLTKKVKQNIIKKFQVAKDDTGSSAVQVALLTRQIHELTLHLKTHAKDLHSKKGLLKMVADRRKHLEYLKKHDEKMYKKVLKDLDLKR